MGIVFMDGFAHYGVSQAGRTWSLVSNPSGISIGASYGRGDSKSGVNMVSTGSLRANLPISSSAYVVIGFAFYMPSLPSSGSWTLCNVLSSTGTKQSVQIDSNGYVSICQGSGSTPYAGCTSNWIAGAGVWHYCEYKVTSTASTAFGDCGVMIDGVPYVVMPALVNTSGFGDITMFSIGYATGPSASYNVTFADLIVSDSGGYVGDRVIHTLFPVADGSELDFSVTGASNGYSAVSETSPDLDTSYVSSSTVGNTQSFVMADPSHELFSITGVQVIACCELVSGTTPVLSCGLKISGSDYLLSSRSPTSSYAYGLPASGSNISFGVNPSTSSPWVNGDLASLEASVKLV